ncbi:unnamed protein product [Amaranthus hypochondriacus]
MEDANNKKVAPPLGNSPWLVFTHGDSRKKMIQTFCSMSSLPTNNQSFIKSIPQLRGFDILGSYHGWLILRNIKDHNIISLCNLITLQSISLPPLPRKKTEENDNTDINDEVYDDDDDGDGGDDDDNDEDEDVFCALTSPPNSANSLLCLFIKDQVFSCRITTDSTISNWNTQKLKLDGERIESISNNFIMHGIIYSLTQIYNPRTYGIRYYLTAIEVVDEKTNTKINTNIAYSLVIKSLAFTPQDNYGRDIRSMTNLVESYGHVYCVETYIRNAYDDNFSRVTVFELDFSTKNWVEIKSLNGRAFFIDYNSCTWCWGLSSSSFEGLSIQENCVYKIISVNKRIICCYNIVERSMTLLSLSPYLTTPISSYAWVNAAPISLPVQRLGSIQKQERIIEMKQLPNQRIEEDSLIKLPDDIIYLISTHTTHLFDYWNLRLSCKKCEEVIPLIPEWGSSHNNRLPLFIFFKDDEDGLCKVMDPFRSDSYYTRLRIFPNPSTLYYSNNGWLIMISSFEGISSLKFFNPFTRVIIDFPTHFNIFFDLTSIGFSSYPNSPDFLMVAFDPIFKGIGYFRFGDTSWTYYTFPNENDQFKIGISSPVYLQGCFYILDVKGYLGSFALIDGEENWQVYSKPPQLCFNIFHSYHLVECEGQLIAVFIKFIGLCVQVFKFNIQKRKWVEIKNIGEYSLFLGKSSFSAKIEEVEKRNRIYISRLKGEKIIFYSLLTKQFHATGTDDESIQDFYNTTEQLDSFWL